MKTIFENTREVGCNSIYIKAELHESMNLVYITREHQTCGYHDGQKYTTNLTISVDELKGIIEGLDS